jgi:hypothetical protein
MITIKKTRQKKLNKIISRAKEQFNERHLYLTYNQGKT